MGLDGFSMRNLGAYQGTVPSSHLSFEAKELVKVGRDKKIKDVDELEKWEKIDENEEEEYSGSGGYREGSAEENEEHDYSDTRYKVKLNSQTNLIELYDTKTDVIIETITPQELMLLIKNLNASSGIFVNKKI